MLITPLSLFFPVAVVLGMTVKVIGATNITSGAGDQCYSCLQVMASQNTAQIHPWLFNNAKVCRAPRLAMPIIVAVQVHENS